jgi:hypothetical protein
MVSADNFLRRFTGDQIIEHNRDHYPRPLDARLPWQTVGSTVIRSRQAIAMPPGHEVSDHPILTRASALA